MENVKGSGDPRKRQKIKYSRVNSGKQDHMVFPKE